MPTNFSGTILPSDATLIKGTNATAITAASAQSILAAPTNTAQAYYLNTIIITQPTAAETVMITIREITGSATLMNVYVGAGETVVIQLGMENLIKVTTGYGVEGIASGSLGDTLVTIHGWLGTPTATTY